MPRDAGPAPEPSINLYREAQNIESYLEQITSDEVKGQLQPILDELKDFVYEFPNFSAEEFFYKIQRVHSLMDQTGMILKTGHKEMPKRVWKEITDYFQHIREAIKNYKTG